MERQAQETTMSHPARSEAPDLHPVRPASERREQEPNPEEEGQPLPPPEIDGEQEGPAEAPSSGHME
jgi:hypothetical protein